MANGLFGGGDGTFNSPYLVEDESDFIAVGSSSGTYFKQKNEISFVSPNISISVLSPKSYDGSEFGISNYISNTSLFTAITGTVKNLNLYDYEVTMSGTTAEGGGFAKSIVGGTVTNCKATGILTFNGTKSLAKIGGFVGFVQSSANVRQCSFVGTVLCPSHSQLSVGGFVGDMSSALTLRDCFSDGTVSAPNSANSTSCGVGGFIGKVTVGLSIIKGCYSKSSVTGGYVVGGFVGIMGINSNPGCTFEDCFATGRVEGIELVGGFGGYTSMFGTTGIVRRCYSSGTVLGIEKVGGFLGASQNGGDPYITNCYSLSPYVQRKSGSSVLFGRLIGSVVGSGSVMTNNYALDTMELRG